MIKSKFEIQFLSRPGGVGLLGKLKQEGGHSKKVAIVKTLSGF